MTHKKKASMDNIENTADHNKENIIEQLADFDFSSPIQVNIIFDDEEDQSSAPEVHIKAEKTDTEDNTKNVDKKLLNELEIQGNNEVVLQSHSTIESSPKNSRRVAVEGIKDNYNSRVELGTHKNLKRKLDEHTFTGPNCVKIVTRTDNTPKNNAFHQEQSITSHHTTNSPNISNDNENAVNSNAEMTCITNLLQSVSSHLIFILDAYHMHLQLQDRALNPCEKEKYMSNFRRIKYHFFNLSFCTVDNIILPQENNLLFTGQFLNDTVKLAATKNRTLCLETQVAPLFFELLQWSKQKKMEINKIQSRTVNDLGHIQNNPVLRRHLENSAKPSVGTAVSDNSNISVNIEQQQLHSEGSTEFGNLNRHLNNNIFPKPSFNPIYVSNEGTAVPRHIMNRSAGTNVKYQRLPPTTSEIVPQGCNISTYAKHSIFPPVQCRNGNGNTYANPLKDLQEPYKKLQSVATTNTYIPPTNISENPKSVVFSTGPPERRISISINQSILETSNCNTTNSVSSMSNICYPSEEPVSPPSYDETLNRRNQFCIQSSHNTVAKVTSPWLQSHDYHGSVQAQPAEQTQSIQAQTEQPNPEITRSMSTDSGFMSPLNFNNPLETKKDSVEDNPLLSPMITHITSLHPKVSYITEGLCSVCRKPTRKMCVGCYKRYYCSNLCQRVDWSIHQAMCRYSS